MEPFCSVCFKPGVTKRCPKCHRAYCSRECQKIDWKDKGHKQWCQKAGQFGVDFEFREMNKNKIGAGVIALRGFQRGEVVMVEAPTMVYNGCHGVDDMTRCAQSITNSLIKTPDNKYVIDLLLPKEESAFQKILQNLNNLGNGVAGLFPVSARINHCCIGNARAVTISSQNMQAIKCIRDISAGEEITQQFVEVPERRHVRQVVLKRSVCFDCTCIACKQPKLSAKLEEIGDLDKEMKEDQKKEKWNDVIKVGEKLIEVYDFLKYSPENYCRTYYAMFQAKIRLEDFPNECVEYAKKALENAELLYDENHGIIKNLRAVVADPVCYFSPEVNKSLAEFASGVGGFWAWA